MKQKTNRNLLIGIAFIASLVLLYFGLNYLKGKNIFKKSNMYVALFDDVTGLATSTPVYVNGFQIGLVDNIEMAGQEPLQFAVRIRLNEEFKLPKGSSMEFSVDFLGAATASLQLNPERTAYYESGDTIFGKKEVGLMDGVTQMAPKLDSLLIVVDSVFMGINKLVSNPTVETAIQDAGYSIAQLKTTTLSLNRIMKVMESDIPTMTNNLNVVTSDLKDISNEINQMDLQKTYASIDETLANLKDISEKVNSSETSVGKLINDTQLHDSLASTLNMATQLLEDIRTNPDKYLSVRVRLFK
jgi:phospholipid/cholesterol/gamma-HCH transport system substrate-binding protein